MAYGVERVGYRKEDEAGERRLRSTLPLLENFVGSISLLIELLVV